MKKFLNKHAAKITGTLSCFDRILFKGYLPLTWPEAMEQFITHQGLRIKDFKRFVTQQSARVRAHAENAAQQAGRPYVRLNSPIRKEARAKAIAKRDQIRRGLVCVFTAVETCQTFKLAYGEGRPRLIHNRGKCLCVYFYFIDPEYGFMHVRIPTWFPFTIQVCINGHEWLARKMDHHSMKYRKIENAFVSIADPGRAQRFADRFTRKNWPRVLSALARRVNPLLKDPFRHMNYYWVTEQAEFATDVLFPGRRALQDLYEKLLKHATLCFSAEDVMTFLGRKLHGNFGGEILNSYKNRWPGARVRHGMKENWIKMYDKHGSILRIETVINAPYEFMVYRKAKRHDGRREMCWGPMIKGVANFYRYAEVSYAANRRYLDALAVVEDPHDVKLALRVLAQPVHHKGRAYRGFNPAAQQDVVLLATVMRGEHLIKGFRNQDIRRQLFKPTSDTLQTRRDSARISRLLKRLHVRGLIAKIPRSRRWRVSVNGHAVMTMILKVHHEQYEQVFLNKAA